MKNITPNELINNLQEDTLYIIQQVEENLQPLSEDILNYKPSPDKWSIIECIEHMNIADSHYYQEISKKLDTHHTSPRDSYNAGALGNYFTKTMKPKEDNIIPNKMKTFSRFYPVISLQATQRQSIIDAFLKDQKTMLGLLDKAKGANLEKIKIKSALGGWLMFKLGDAFRFVIAHNQRHVLQAMNVLNKYRAQSDVIPLNSRDQ